MSNIKRAHEDYKALVDSGNASRSDGVYVTVKPQYSQTKYKTVPVSSFVLTYDEFQVYKNYMFLRKNVEKAKEMDPFFLGKHRKPIGDLLSQVCNPAWEDAKRRAFHMP